MHDLWTRPTFEIGRKACFLWPYVVLTKGNRSVSLKTTGLDNLQRLSGVLDLVFNPSFIDVDGLFYTGSKSYGHEVATCFLFIV